MDTFESIRRAAIELRSRLPNLTGDGLKAPKVVAAAAQELDLEVIPLDKSDPLLQSGAAFLDTATRTIFHRDGTAAECAALIAHEIGHACLHAGPKECSADDIDVARSEEMAPIGLQRVEDYGGHERRELQANVFARELLFPRTLGRQLHAVERISAREIAARLVLPLDLVRQQLVDALLLPPPPETSGQPTAPTAFRPDPSQERAIDHAGSPFLLEAGPGTGKTRTLVLRVEKLLRENVAPESIVVLTFSNRAAGELVERLHTSVPDSAAKIWAGTFHAFGLDIIRRYHDRLDLSPDPPLFDRSDAIAVLEEILPTLPLVHYRELWRPALVLREILSAISRAKDELVVPAQYRELAERMPADSAEERERREKALEVAHVYELYERAIRQRGAVDFGDLVMLPTLLLESDPAVRQTMQLRHRHILVDEYQDVNRASARLVRALAGDARRLWVVGDSRQAIYRFRGASSTNMVRFASDYSDATVDRLATNYRSSPEIVGLLRGISPRMRASHGMQPLDFVAAKPERSVVPTLASVASPVAEIDAIAGRIRELQAAGVVLREQAVLCRSNMRLGQIAAGLEERGIAVLHLGSLFEREEIRDLLSVLAFLASPLGDGLVRVAAMPRYAVPLQDVYEVLRTLDATRPPSAAKMSVILSGAPLSPAGRSGLELLAADLDGIGVGESPWEILTTYLLDRTFDLADREGNRDIAATMRGVALWQFLNFARTPSPVSTRLRVRRLLDQVRQMVLLAEERDLRQVPAAALHLEGVRLVTVHGSKGLEFEAVHVPGMTQTNFPLTYRAARCPPPEGMIEGLTVSAAAEAEDAHDTEEECLFFVAASRAKRHLRFYSSRTQPSGKSRQPSTLLPWLDGAIEKLAPPGGDQATTASGTEDRLKVTWPPDRVVSDGDLRLYETCPRRYFYTRVLGVGSAGTTSSFDRTHSCVRAIAEWIAAQTNGDDLVDRAVAELERLWEASGPKDHAFADDYHRLAVDLTRFLARSFHGATIESADAVTVPVEDQHVVVELSAVIRRPDGRVSLRRINTGKRRSDEEDELVYGLYHLVGRTRHGGNHIVEAVFLAEERVVEVELTDRKVGNRVTKASGMIRAIRAGAFPPDPNAVTCPRCPHFHACPALPEGPLTLA